MKQPKMTNKNIIKKRRERIRLLFGADHIPLAFSLDGYMYGLLVVIPPALPLSRNWV